MIPFSEVERIADDAPLRAIKAADTLHDLAVALGNDEGLSDDEMEQLHAARPGRLPWGRVSEAAE